jgi:outer membrane biosynthesis protein TonB
MIRKSLPIILSCAMLVFVALTPLWLAGKAVETKLRIGNVRTASHGVGKKFQRLSFPEIIIKQTQASAPIVLGTGLAPQMPPKSVAPMPSPKQPVVPPIKVPPVVKPPIRGPVPIDPQIPVCPPCGSHDPGTHTSNSLIMCPMDSSLRYLCAS